MDAKQKFFKKPAITAAFGVVALFGGFYFLGTKITGNVVRETSSGFSALSFIGLLLIACSAVLVVYSIKKK